MGAILSEKAKIHLTLDTAPRDAIAPKANGAERSRAVDNR
jgi:hypothetical protein